MGPPSWLYYIFGLGMLAIAAYGVVLLVLSVTGRHHPGRDVDIAHIFMGISMAGMFVTKWSSGPNALWELIFASLMVWFVVRSLQSIQRFGLHKPHEAIHATMSFAMLLMYWYPMGSTTGAVAMSMSMSPGAQKLDPGLGLALVMIFLASAVFTLASPVKGASHHGTHAFAYATIGADGREEARTIASRNGSSPLEAAFTTPWLEDASHIAMCVAMAFMLVLML
jgi:hypothetical protein